MVGYEPAGPAVWMIKPPSFPGRQNKVPLPCLCISGKHPPVNTSHRPPAPLHRRAVCLADDDGLPLLGGKVQRLPALDPAHRDDVWAIYRGHRGSSTAVKPSPRLSQGRDPAPGFWGGCGGVDHTITRASRGCCRPPEPADLVKILSRSLARTPPPRRCQIPPAGRSESGVCGTGAHKEDHCPVQTSKAAGKQPKKTKKKVQVRMFTLFR